MERLRRRVDAIVKDPATAEALKPYYRFMCKRPLSNNDYYADLQPPNVKLIDVSATQGLERDDREGLHRRRRGIRDRLHDLRLRASR